MIGARMAGGNPAGERQRDDFYPTPPGVTLALLRREAGRIPERLWEPACGDGAMAEVLKAAGHRVAATDLVGRGYGKGGVDFLKANVTWNGGIITNPPFNLAAAFIDKAHEVGAEYIALVLKSTYWHAFRTRGDLFNRHPPSAVYGLGWRPDFLRKGAPTMEVMWCVWRKERSNVIEYDILPGSDAA